MLIAPASGTYSENVYLLKKYRDDYYKLVYLKRCKESGWEPIDEEKEEVNNSPIHKAKLEQSLSRTKRIVSDICLCNDFEYFFTGTFDINKIDRFDIEIVRTKLLNSFANYKKRYNKDFKYILIPEYHKNKALHVHGLLVGIRPKDLHINDNGYLDWMYYTERFGFMSLSKIQDSIRTSFYISKYITKDVAVTVGFGKRLFWNSTGLKRPEVKLVNPDDLSITEYDFANDYMACKTFYKLSDIMK